MRKLAWGQMAAVAALAMACGGRTNGAAGGTPEQPATAHPPPDPKGPAVGGSFVTALVVQKLFLGETDRQFQPELDAWKHYGYDLDGHYSTKDSSAHCTPYEGMNPAAVKTDAEGGIDNSFGANVMPIFKSLPPEQNPSQNLTDAIAGGAETGLFRFVGLAGSANQSPVSAGFLGGAEFVGTPAWNTTDTWPVTAESVDGSPESPKVSLPSYVSEGTWVAHATGPIRLDPRLRVWQSSAIHELVIHEALVTAELSVSGTSLVAKNGIIAGVIDTEELVDALTKTLAKLDPTMCQGAMLESMAEQLRAASDIMKDGTNGDPSQSCDGISVGIGFEAITAMIGPVAEPVPPSPNPCAN